MGTRSIYRIRGKGGPAYVYKHWDGYPSAAADYLRWLDTGPIEFCDAATVASDMVDRVNRLMKEQHDRMARDMAADGQKISPFHPDCSLSTRHEWHHFEFGYMYDVDLGRREVTVTAAHMEGSKRLRAKAHVKAKVDDFGDDGREPGDLFP